MNVYLFSRLSSLTMLVL